MSMQILEPKIIDDQYEGKHAVVQIPNVKTMLDIIDDNDLYTHERSETWQYGKHVVGRENVQRALMVGRTSDAMMKIYQKLRSSIDT